MSTIVEKILVINEQEYRNEIADYSDAVLKQNALSLMQEMFASQTTAVGMAITAPAVAGATLPLALYGAHHTQRTKQKLFYTFQELQRRQLPLPRKRDMFMAAALGVVPGASSIVADEVDHE
ncbi:hypothetical protein F5X68DRAFT_227592 [Plectosphaerella plurivora]|uniref:Uncharacterized protein n=1 Tax=Plectosphaerella plurivora TaxID=936078 RepID=A0A9P8VLC7_9PEZI|nr:hypothetical protein F5X68DRAFT_227592 [Plectosphaerella plurivora]